MTRHSRPKVKIYKQTKFRQGILIHLWDMTTSCLEKQTSAILAFFLLRFWSDHSNLRAILNQFPQFRLNRATRGGEWRHIQFLDGNCGDYIVLPVWYLIMSLSSKGKHLSANQISSTYLNLWLRYNYLRSGKTTVRHIEIVLPVSILTISPCSTYHSTLGCRISFQSIHPQRRFDVISTFKISRRNSTSGFRSGNAFLFGCQFLSSQPNIVVITLSSFEIYLFPLSKNKRPPYWKSTSGFDFDHITAVCMSFCTSLQNFVQIGPLTADKWRHVDFHDGGSAPSWISEVQ